MRGLTAAQRVEHLTEFVSSGDLYQHLTTVPGVSLSGRIRWAVLQCAREALTCSGCAVVGTESCIRPGMLLKVVNGLSHDQDFPKCGDATVDAVGTAVGDDVTTTATILRNLVHTFVHHQSKLDKKWYDATIHLLDTQTNLIPPHIQERNDRDYLLRAIYGEVAALTMIAQCVVMAFVAMGRPVPSLPTLQDMEHLKPSYLVLTSMIKSGSKGLRFDPTLCTITPFFLSSDMDKSKMQKAFPTPQEYSLLTGLLMGQGPWIGVACFAPKDMFIVHRTFEKFMYNSSVSIIIILVGVIGAGFLVVMLTGSRRQSLNARTQSPHCVAAFRLIPGNVLWKIG